MQSGEVDETTGCNAQGQYSIQRLPAPRTYYMYAWNYYYVNNFIIIFSSNLAIRASW